MALRLAIAAMAAIGPAAPTRAPPRCIASGRLLLARGCGDSASPSSNRGVVRAYHDDGRDGGGRESGRFDRRSGGRDRDWGGGRFGGRSGGRSDRDEFGPFTTGRDRSVRGNDRGFRFDDGGERFDGRGSRFDDGGERFDGRGSRRSASDGRGSRFDGRGSRRSASDVRSSRPSRPEAVRSSSPARRGASESRPRRASTLHLRPSEVVPKGAEVLFGLNSVLAALEGGGRSAFALYALSDAPRAPRRDASRSAADEAWSRWVAGEAPQAPRPLCLPGAPEGSAGWAGSPSHADKQTGRLAARAHDRAVDLARLAGVPVVPASARDLAALAAEGSHQGLALICSSLEPQTLDEFPQVAKAGVGATGASSLPLGEEATGSSSLPLGEEATGSLASSAPVLFLALDEVQDPRNLGAIVRCSTVLGADETLVCARNCAPLSSSASRASAGALERAPPKAVGSLPRALKAARERGWRVVGADAGPGAVPASDLASTLKGPTLLVLGSEGTGLRPLVRKLCHDLVKVDQSDAPAARAVGSLNVSVAAGILLRELRAALDRNARDANVPVWRASPEDDERQANGPAQAATIGERQANGSAQAATIVEEVWSVETGVAGLERIERFERNVGRAQELAASEAAEEAAAPCPPPALPHLGARCAGPASPSFALTSVRTTATPSATMFGAIRSATRVARAVPRVQRRAMSSGVSAEEEVKEMNKWRLVTFIAIPACIAKGFLDFSHPHEHAEEHPDYPYLNIHNKDFPWGPEPLFGKAH